MKTSLISLLTALFAFLPSAHAYDVVTSPYLSGDWDGTRTSLSQKGIDIDLGYASEVAHNFSGGTRELTDYTDQWVIGADFDFEKLGFWKGGQLVAVVSDRNGNDLGADAHIGNDMLIQEVYGRGQTWHVTKFWYNQKFFDNKLEWKFGRLTVGEDFANFSCDFQNLTFCGAQPGNLVGNYWINWPTSVWATRVMFHATAETTWLIGAYQDNPTYADDNYARKYGWTLDNPSGSQGTLIPLEFDWAPKFNGHAGIYRFGAWYDTTLASDLGDMMSMASQWGVYISIEQQLTGTEKDPGFSVFLNVTQADPKTAAVDRQISLGTEYHAPFKRINDAIGFAIGATNNNSRYADYVLLHNEQTGQIQVVGDRDEYVTELFYSYAPIASIFLRPNLQYILQPGGIASNPNAFVIGLKSGVSF